MTVWWQAGIAVASLGLMYFVCIRPMRQGRHAGMSSGAKSSCCSPSEDAEITRLRAEVESLRQESAQARDV